MQKKRLTFGVVAAQASDIEQRRIMEGIIEQAKALNIDTVVISNIYNPDKSVYTLDCRKENNIYELLNSSGFAVEQYALTDATDNDVRLAGGITSRYIDEGILRYALEGTLLTAYVNTCNLGITQVDVFQEWEAHEALLIEAVHLTVDSLQRSILHVVLDVGIREDYLLAIDDACGI